MRNKSKRKVGRNFLKKNSGSIKPRTNSDQFSIWDSNRISKINFMNLTNFESDEISNEFLDKEDKIEVILIFYCEFSSERGPKMYNFFRNFDRLVNQYPNLHYPQTYVMQGGFSKFHENFKYFCKVNEKESEKNDDLNHVYGKVYCT